jgi:nicotinate-nucleotide pyrophosphorylase (carboxylating)
VKLQDLVKAALQEDMPQGDVTTDSLGCDQIAGRAAVVAKQDLVLSGVEAFSLVYKELDSTVRVNWLKRNGDAAKKGETVCTLDGSLSSLLKGERTALNFLGRLSGVATLTSKFTAKVKDTKTKIVDTRKTTPGWRELEKAAVKHGGGHNHRMNLSDQVLIKENHIRAAGGITRAVEKIRHAHPKIFIEVEVTNLNELAEALKAKVNEVLLDNMNLDLTREAVKLVGGACQIEASGNMALDRVESVAKLGVDFISVGLLTHSAPCADLSMLFEHLT